MGITMLIQPTQKDMRLISGVRVVTGIVKLHIKNIKRGIGLTPVCIWYHFEHTSFLIIYAFIISINLKLH